MRKFLIVLCCLLAGWSTISSHSSSPWTFWYWMYGAVSEEGIRADLQAMKDVGLGGCYLMPIRSAQEHPEFQGQADALSPQFWRMIDLAMQQADSLGLEMGIHICDGFALAGGPWISPEESMQKIVWSDTLISVTRQGGEVPVPHAANGYEDYYEDIAMFAIQATKPLPEPQYGGTIVRDEKGTFRSKEPGYIELSYQQPQTIHSVEIIPSGNNLQAQRLLAQTSNDSINFQTIRQLTPPRQGWQNTDLNYTYALPETTARFFRFYWTPEGTEPGSEDLDAAKWSPVLKIKDIRLSAEPRIDQYESKNGSVWRIAPSYDMPMPTPQVIRVTPQTILPTGLWRIVRIGHTSTGHTNATAGGAKGLECDKFSAEAVGKQVDSWFGEFKKRPHADVVKYLHVDSWECGSQNWSRNFAQEFKTRRGYDLLPWLPVMIGIPIESAAKSDEVLRDVRLTINELINEVFFTTVARKAKEYGVRLSSESVAPTMVSDGMEHYKYVDIPMGEFWLNSPTHDKPNDMLDAISGAHVYGKPIVQAEGFTEVRGVWDETPASIKTLLDRNFAWGMNRLFFHVNTHNPWLDRRPGMTLDGIGLFFQRDQTWFPEAKAFVDYITRCQSFLQRGRPVVDIAVYTGDEMPSRSLTPDRLVPMLPGLFGEERVVSEQKRLANVGCPMEESPVGVRHSAGIIDLKDWVNPLHGYKYDSMNPDGLKRWLSQLEDPALDDMPHYRVLIVPEKAMVSEASREKINALKQYGIKVITSPVTSSTLPDILPDVILPEGIDFTHRLVGRGTHHYFLTNQTDSVITFKAKFRINSNITTIGDPLTGNLLAFKGGREGDYAFTDITLQGHGSVIVSAGYDYVHGSRRSQQVVTELSLGNNLKWDVVFRENGEHIQTKVLFDWSQSDNERIRYYSGHAHYKTKFNYSGKSGDSGIYLHLPDIRDIAHVWLNGHDCGITWTAPYEVDITKALKKGKNSLEIEVVNTWHNALRGMDEGKAPYDGIWTNAKYRTKGTELLPAGLLKEPIIKIKR